MLSIRFDTMPSAPHWHAWGEHGRQIFSDVFVEQDAGLGIAQQVRQPSLALKERGVAPILAILLDKWG